jgi:hypothetical protein
VLPVWLVLVPFEVTEPEVGEVGEVGVDGLVLPDVDGDVVAFGWCCVGVVVGLGVVVVAQGVPVALAVVLPVALVSAVAEAVADVVV